MKKALVLSMAVVACAVFVAGCATNMPIGTIYTELVLPVAVTSNGAASPKVGTAECTSILAMVATGDCSIEAAKQNGGITKVHHVDWDVKSIMGIQAVYKLTVYGQ